MRENVFWLKYPKLFTTAQHYRYGKIHTSHAFNIHDADCYRVLNKLLVKQNVLQLYFGLTLSLYIVSAITIQNAVTFICD